MLAVGAVQQYPPPLPPGAAPASIPHSTQLNSAPAGGGLEPTSSVQPGEGIKLHHVICNSELVLKEVIGSGAEGKVRSGNHADSCCGIGQWQTLQDEQLLVCLSWCSALWW